ncbi:MAG: hypothetical protein M1497_15735 [Nitrospirae bacterium]|nr:hypothetical protein [Nitrospirota bacterium]
MEPDTRTCIASIAGKLISNRGHFCLYDYSRSLHVQMTCLPHPEQIRRQGYARKVFAPGSGRGSRYRYTCSCGRLFDIAIHGNTFIGYASGSSSHFIGNVRGDSIYLYDDEESAHFNYRISARAVGDEAAPSISFSCGRRDAGRIYERT